MSSSEHAPQRENAISGLDELIVTYDMRKLLEEAQSEFESIVSTRELLGQQAIGSFFNLNLREDERN